MRQKTETISGTYNGQPVNLKKTSVDKGWDGDNWTKVIVAVLGVVAAIPKIWDSAKDCWEIIKNEKKTDSGTDCPKAQTLQEILSMPVVETPWIVPGMIRENEIVGVVGRRKTGKTTFLMSLAIQMAMGEVINPMTGKIEPMASPLTVIYVDTESLPQDYKCRYGKYGFDFSKYSNLKIISAIAQSAEQIQKAIETETESINGNCIIFIDNLKSILETSQPIAMKGFIDYMKSSQTEINKKGFTRAYVLAVHTTKEYNSWQRIEDMYIEGSNTLFTHTGSMFAFEETKDGNNTRMVRMHYIRNGDLNDKAFLCVRKADYPYLRFEFTGEEVDEQEYLPLSPKERSKNSRAEIDSASQASSESMAKKMKRQKALQEKFETGGPSYTDLAKQLGESVSTLKLEARKMGLCGKHKSI